MKIKHLFIPLVMIALSLESYSQVNLSKLVPKPQQAYVRGTINGVFSFHKTTKIYLNPTNPAITQAFEFNVNLKNLGLDTLEIASWNESDTLLTGVVLGVHDDFINKLFTYIPDQNIAVTSNYPGSEGYVIDVLPVQTIISGSDSIGLHYGIITFFQYFQASASLNSAFSGRIVDAPEFPIRWFYFPTNIQITENLPATEKIWSQCSNWKLNGMNLSDSKFCFLNNVVDWYFTNLKTLKDYAKSNYLKIVPGVFPYGWSNDMLYNDVNLASGLPVFDQKFVIQGDSFKLVPHLNVSLSNPGFEQHNGNNFPGFSWIDDPGKRSFADNTVKHSGNTSIRWDSLSAYPNMNSRMFAVEAVKPYTEYHASAWIKTDSASWGWGPHIEAVGNKNPSFGFDGIDVNTTQDWTKVDVTMNSLGSDTANIIWGVWGTTGGKIWWDDLVFEEVPFVNLIRREGAPLKVTKNGIDISNEEGISFDSIIDPKMGFLYTFPGGYDNYHTPPTIKIKKGGSLQNGDTVLVSYYHMIQIEGGGVAMTTSGNYVFDVMEKQFSFLDSLLKPDIYFMGHDELRTMNWDFGDLSRGMTPAQLLADNANKCVELIHKYNPNADIWDWSDMYDEFHNANHDSTNPYYMVNGSLHGSADMIDKSIGIANWGPDTKSSFNFFANKGFRQISTPYYDTNVDEIRQKKEDSYNYPNYQGMMYTSWSDPTDFSLIEPYSEYAWGHAPYIYHDPSMVQISKSQPITLSVFGDKWDTGWNLTGAKIYYRTSVSDSFKIISFIPPVGIDTSVTLSLPDNAKWLQYYITASDNRNWTKKIPFGDTVYFEVGYTKTNINEMSVNNGLRIYNCSPNPINNSQFINLEWSVGNAENVIISINDVFANELYKISLMVNKNLMQNTKLDVSNLSSGVYFIRIKTQSCSAVWKIVKYE